MNFEIDRDVVPDEYPARFQSRIPGQAEVLSADGGACRCRNTNVTPRVPGFGRNVVYMECDTTRDAVYGQITVNAKLVARRPDDLGRLKGYQRIALGIEEARAAQIGVPLLVPRLDGRRLDFDRHTRLGNVVRA